MVQSAHAYLLRKRNRPRLLALEGFDPFQHGASKNHPELPPVAKADPGERGHQWMHSFPTPGFSRSCNGRRQEARAFHQSSTPHRMHEKASSACILEAERPMLCRKPGVRVCHPVKKSRRNRIVHARMRANRKVRNASGRRTWFFGVRAPRLRLIHISPDRELQRVPRNQECSFGMQQHRRKCRFPNGSLRSAASNPTAQTWRVWPSKAQAELSAKPLGATAHGA